jgi:hypothetical protein
MKSFKDRNGVTWDIDVHPESIERVKARTNVDLLEVFLGDGGATNLLGNLLLLVRVLAVLCEQQAESRKVTPEEFGKVMRGDCLEEAGKALMGDIADFFPSGRRAIFQKMISKSADLSEKAAALLCAKVDAMKLEDLLPQTPSARSTSSPATSASTPAASPSENFA